MQDLVTLRTPGPQSPQNFYRLAVQVLRTYGVSTEYGSGLVFFEPVHLVLMVVFGTFIGLLGSLLSVGRHLRHV